MYRSVRLAFRGARATPGVVRALVRALRNAPNPRLTALGGGLFCTMVMVLLAFLDAVLLGGSMVVYGVLFLPVSMVTALWVRRIDVLSAPVSVPIGFAAGVLPLAAATGGFATRVMGLFTALAMHAGWLYGGTLIAGVIATVRKIRLLRRRAAARRTGRGVGMGTGTGRPRPTVPARPRTARDRDGATGPNRAGQTRQGHGRGQQGQGQGQGQGRPGQRGSQGRERQPDRSRDPDRSGSRGRTRLSGARSGPQQSPPQPRRRPV
ncbi:DUF6542 domain-containing protein [Streptomyces odontomachi]|uniref:DUF6542 domain-containing protein n=1 Tax=Streptomyces odontomachi TaxID=2944940 RepID=UPI0027E36F0A|nr:DUF6542 domain-containing protein [Streptomyces sp. ODS25]